MSKNILLRKFDGHGKWIALIAYNILIAFLGYGLAAYPSTGITIVFTTLVLISGSRLFCYKTALDSYFEFFILLLCPLSLGLPGIYYYYHYYHYIP